MGLWIGEALSPLERACIHSFLARGHDFELYAYGPVSFVPDGCRVLDARAIVPADRIFMHREGEGQGSVAIFADLFRYQLLYERGGWWVDLDVFCLTQQLPDHGIVVGRQDEKLVNGAVLCFPAGHPLMAAAVKACTKATENAIWGAYGPLLLTRLAHEYGLSSAVFPPDLLYPVDWQHYWAVLDPRRAADVARKMQGAVCLHLWNEMLRRVALDKQILPPEGSVLRALYEDTIGVDGFTQEYLLAPGCAPDALQLQVRPYSPV